MKDTIYRQDAIDAVNAYLGLSAVSRTVQNMTSIQEILEKMPSAQPERKTGKWRRRLVDCGFNADWHCSRCGWKTSLEEHGYNFCPNCGADMRGDANEQTTRQKHIYLP